MRGNPQLPKIAEKCEEWLRLFGMPFRISFFCMYHEMYCHNEKTCFFKFSVNQFPEINYSYMENYASLEILMVVWLRTPCFWDTMPHARYLVADVFKGHNVFNFKGLEVYEKIMLLLCTKRLLLRLNCTCSFIINRWYFFTHKHGYPYIYIYIYMWFSFNQFIMKNTVLWLWSQIGDIRNTFQQFSMLILHSVI